MKKKEYQAPEARIFVFGPAAIVQAYVDDGEGNHIPSYGGDGEFDGDGGGWNDYPWLTT